MTCAATGYSNTLIFNSNITSRYADMYFSPDQSVNIRAKGDGSYPSRLYIGNTGNVGIGTTTPNAQLDVKGIISNQDGTLCNRINVYNGNGPWTKTITITGGTTGGGIEVTLTGWGASGGGWVYHKSAVYGHVAVSNNYNLSGSYTIVDTYGYNRLFTVAINNPSGGTYTWVLTSSWPYTSYIWANISAIGAGNLNVTIS